MEQNNQNNFPSQPPQNGGGASEKKHLEWVLTNQNEISIKIAKLESNHGHINQSLSKIEDLLSSSSDKLSLGQERLSETLSVQVNTLVQETRKDIKELSSDFKSELKSCDENFKKEIKESNSEIRKINIKIAWAVGALAGAIFLGGILINGSLGKIHKLMEQSAKAETSSQVKTK
ncbi:conserved hypothetical protein [Pseudoalteromonas sp. 3J6]|uniref:hypothetical protein n=1 Tax=Pseudoalteromonas sp. 3J6 TaxID=649161 RepID=UPI00175B151C|nr:hypothetical protein [Pseudoalteromonas sp. 3J6]CAD2225026.1 conserved hypothetical protein [Pseudoalteromonas sp. 3J6]